MLYFSISAMSEQGKTKVFRCGYPGMSAPKNIDRQRTLAGWVMDVEWPERGRITTGHP